ncbi:UNVERIFIED_CONTAM: NADPH2 dehydrogenase [Brevibacillus sp. OAP136]
MSKLFSPITLGSLNLKNRIVMSPMCQYSADEEGFVTDWHPVHYVSRAVGGVGAIVVEASAVEPDGRISSHDLGIWQDAHVAKLAQIVKQVHQHDVKIGIQLAHAGRKSESAKAPVSSSDIAFSEKYAQPRALSIPELQVIVDKFREAGERAAQAGFDFIEIHAAHGYLINQFLSPLVNNRSDEYGGSMENRFRFLREIVLAVRERWSGRLFVRLSAEEYANGGNHIEEYVVFSKWLKELGVTLVDASSGARSSPSRFAISPATKFLWQSGFARRLVSRPAPSAKSPRLSWRKRSSAWSRRIWSFSDGSCCAIRTGRFKLPKR